ncbi:serpin family protein [Streptomyces xanthochromogenes]|uniref:serpin family protein n=1 Tax=Streptomyces xanthochromogenes TaxID=67384 RepID=UPI00342F9404
MTSKGAAISAANALTARWAREHTGTGDTVFSAAAVWPLLALLAAGAHGPARAELADAVGLRPEEAAAGARALLSHVHALPGVHTAAGLWTRRTLELRPGWSSRRPRRYGRDGCGRSRTALPSRSPAPGPVANWSPCIAAPPCSTGPPWPTPATAR